MHCEAGVTVVDGVALVTATLDNPVAVPRHVRVSNRLHGPVCPPRQAGVPAVGWDRDGVTLRIEADGRMSVGYACPLGGREPADPPAIVADTARAEGDDRDGRACRSVGAGPDDRAARPLPDDDRRRVRIAIHRLGRTGPPRDAVPIEPEPPGRSRPDIEPPGDGCHDADSGESGTGSGPGNSDHLAVPDPDSVRPAAATVWLDRIADRVAAAEALTDPQPLDAADALATAHDVQAEPDAANVSALPPLDAAERLASRSTPMPRRSGRWPIAPTTRHPRRPGRPVDGGPPQAGPPGGRPVILAVVGGKGGVGKTTLSYNLAAALDATAVDGDLGMADLPTGRGPDLHDVLAGRAAIGEAIRGGRVPIVACGRSLAGARAADAAALARVLRRVDDRRGPVVVDFPAGMRADIGVPLAVADAALVVLAPEPFAVADAVRTRELARTLDAGLVGVAVNRVVDQAPTAAVREALGAPATPVPADPRLGRSVAEEAPVVTAAPGSEAAGAVRTLAERVADVDDSR